MKTNRLLLVMTFMSAILFGTNLYAQQEVDPTWYDPWGGPAANNVTSHPAHQHIAGHKNQPKMVSASPEPQIAKRFVSGASQSQFVAQERQSLTGTFPPFLSLSQTRSWSTRSAWTPNGTQAHRRSCSAGVMAMACTQRRPEATREAPAVIFLRSSLTEGPFPPPVRL